MELLAFLKFVLWLWRRDCGRAWLEVTLSCDVASGTSPFPICMEQLEAAFEIVIRKKKLSCSEIVTVLGGG